MKKTIFTLFILGNIIGFSNIKNPFEDEKIDYVFKNVSQIFSDDYKCKFIIRQEILRAFHKDNNSEERMVKTFEDSLATYGRIIQNNGEFEKIENPIEVTTRYYAKNCKIPEKKWLDYLNLPSLNKYFELVKIYKSN